MYHGEMFRRLETDGSGAIVDLASGKVTVLDKSKRTATEGTIREALQLGMLGFTMGFFKVDAPKALGVRKNFLGYDCDQYETRAMFVFPVTLKQCLSTTAPGVAVVRDFSRKMLAQLPEAGSKLPGEMQSGIVLASESNFGDSTEVTRIEEDGLIAQSLFTIPAGYRKQPLQAMFQR